MSLLTANHLSLSFGAFDVFSSISVRLANNSKIGLIGPNGIGKTSLLRILAGLSQPTTGRVSVARGRRLGYLHQESAEAFAVGTNSVYAEMKAVYTELQAQQERLYRMEAAMATGQISVEQLQELLEKYGTAQETFERAGGYDYEVRIQRTLQGLGLSETHWEMPVCQLSGGQQTRALLARLLLEKPDLLILDEPTNHLDAEAMEWLEHTLRDWDGAVLIVSHDRYFLDKVANTIWEMSRTGIEVYTGNYSAYLQQRQERWEYQQQVFTEEKARLQNDLDFIQRNIARASTNARAVGLLRRLSRDLAIVESFGLMGLRSDQSWHETGLGNIRPLGIPEAARIIQGLQEPSNRPARLNLKLKLIQSSGKVVLRTKNLCVGYPDFPLFTAPDIELNRSECAALIGANGTGKTTFLKTLLGQLKPLAGEIQYGASLKVGYFAQVHQALDPDNTVLDELLSHQSMLVGQARSHLAQYLFRGDDVFKTIQALSGGERGRLALAILALEGANFLLLDEPTNHLDIPAQEALQEVLEHFPGTILLVSHDRYLVDRLATQIWELQDGWLRLFKGPYREYLERRQGSAPAKPETSKARPVPAAKAPRRTQPGSRKPARPRLPA